MKKILFTILSAAILLSACTRDPRPELSYERVTDLKIIVEPGQEQNTYLFRSSRNDVICFWDLGNGSSAQGVNSATGEYPFAGTYTISLRAYGDAGETNRVSMKLVVPGDNLNLLSDPMYFLIAGEIGGPGKTWKMDEARQGHINLLNPNNITDSWYASGPNGKNGCDMYDDEATFVLSSEEGQAFRYVNNGRSCTMNNDVALGELMNDGAWAAVSSNKASTNDNIVVCTPPSNMSWSLSIAGDRYYINFPPSSAGHGGFLFYFTGWNTQYEIRAISDNYMKVFAWASVAGSASLRQFILRTKDTPTGNDAIEWTWTKD